MVNRVIGVSVLSLILLVALFISQQQREPLHVSGYLESDEVRVGSRVGGRVKSVLVDEGDIVRVGQLLIELEPLDLQAKHEEALASLAQQRARLEELKNGYRPEEIAQAHERFQQFEAILEKLKNGPRKQEIEASRANEAVAQFRLDLATQKQRRAEELFAKAAIPQDDMDVANSELKVARADVEARTADLNLLLAGTREEEIREAEARMNETKAAWNLAKNGFRAEEIAAAEATVKAAQAAVKVIQSQLAELRILSPVQGRVEAVDLQPGDLVGANMPAVSVLDTGTIWVRAYVPENHLDLKLKQPVEISVDSFPDRRFSGHLSFIAQQAEFTPGNVQTPEERSKQVFRIKAQLDEGLEKLRPGMAADVWFEKEQAGK